MLEYSQTCPIDHLLRETTCSEGPAGFRDHYICQLSQFHKYFYRLLDSLVVDCWLRVREVPGSIPSQGLRHTKDVIKMVPVVPLFSTEH